MNSRKSAEVATPKRREQRPKREKARYKAKEGQTVDALALRGEEGRDKLRKAAGIGKYEMIRRYPNGTTRPGADPVTALSAGRTWGTETSKYP